MSDLQCPACKKDIDGDSLYCDQCGEQIFVCSVCGRAGKGKRCIFDGKEMVVPGAQAGASPAGASQAGASQTTSQAAAASPSSGTSIINNPPVSTPAPVYQAAQTGAAPASPNKVKFSAQNLGIVIEPKEGDVLGRTKGTFASVLGRLSHISGSHCQILKVNGAWSIMDLGSTNGTFINGAKLNPNTAVPLSNGAKVKLADIEFIISMESIELGTQRI